MLAKWHKDNKVNVLEKPSQSSDFNTVESMWTTLKSVFVEAYKLNLVTRRGMGHNSSSLLQKVCEWLKCLTQVKQFKGHTTKN